LNELTESPDVVSVAVLNSIGEVVVQAGVPLPTKPEELPSAGALWGEDSVMVMNPVEFGEIDHAEGQAPTIVIPPRDDDRDGRDRRDDREPREDREEAGAVAIPPPPPPPPEDDPTTGSREDRRRQSGRFGRP